VILRRARNPPDAVFAAPIGSIIWTELMHFIPYDLRLVSSSISTAPRAVHGSEVSNCFSECSFSVHLNETT
jgi:hypothetical protein